MIHIKKHLLLTRPVRKTFLTERREIEKHDLVRSTLVDYRHKKSIQPKGSGSNQVSSSEIWKETPSEIQLSQQLPVC